MAGSIFISRNMNVIIGNWFNNNHCGILILLFVLLRSLCRLVIQCYLWKSIKLLNKIIFYLNMFSSFILFVQFYKNYVTRKDGSAWSRLYMCDTNSLIRLEELENRLLLLFSISFFQQAVFKKIMFLFRKFEYYNAFGGVKIYFF